MTLVFWRFIFSNHKLSVHYIISKMKLSMPQEIVCRVGFLKRNAFVGIYLASLFLALHWKVSRVSPKGLLQAAILKSAETVYLIFLC